MQLLQGKQSYLFQQITYGTKIAESLNVPQRIISVIAIAIGTSLPELVTTITAIRKKAGSLSVGIHGNKVFNEECNKYDNEHNNTYCCKAVVRVCFSLKG